MGTDQVFFFAAIGRAMGWQRLAAEFFPVGKPGAARAYCVRGSIDIPDLHARFSLLSFFTVAFRQI
jgi:hypothetical protein